MNKRVRIIAEIAIMVALAVVLEVVFSFLPAMPQGGRLSISLLPIIILAWRRGVMPGIVAGLVFAWLNALLDGFNQTWVTTFEAYLTSMFLDYVFAFALVGLTGLVKKLSVDNVYTFGVAIFVGYFIRFLMHLISGAVVYGIYAPEGQSPWLYSFIYNGSYILPSFLFALAVGVGIYLRAKPILVAE